MGEIMLWVFREIVRRARPLRDIGRKEEPVKETSSRNVLSPATAQIEGVTLTKTGGTVPSGGVRNQELSIEGSEAFSPTGANVKI
jgi:hypothetical protein